MGTAPFCIYLRDSWYARDIEKAEKQINEMADQGWILQQVVMPDDGVGAMVGVFYKERKL